MANVLITVIVTVQTFKIKIDLYFSFCNISSLAKCTRKCKETKEEKSKKGILSFYFVWYKNRGKIRNRKREHREHKINKEKRPA